MHLCIHMHYVNKYALYAIYGLYEIYNMYVTYKQYALYMLILNNMSYMQQICNMVPYMCTCQYITYA